MGKQNRKYIYIFLGIFIAVVVIQYLMPKPVNWNRTYLSKDKSPFGCYAIYHLADDVYGSKKTLNTQTFYNLKDKLNGDASIVLVNDRVDFNKNDVRSMYQLLESGNTVFIAANHFDGLLADTFHLSTGYNFYNFFDSIDSLIDKPGDAITLCAKNYSAKKFSYPQLANLPSFKNFDSTRFEVLGTLPGNKACLLSTTIRKGKLILMSTPDVFGNYFIVNHPNRELAYATLSLLKNKEFVWDEYYKTYNEKSYSPIKFILESDALYSAYLLIIFSIIIYMIFEGRRKQRAIPTIEPVTNSTLEFVNVITHVYYNSRNHQNIAAERIKFFYENIRKKFHVNTNEINEAFFTEITELSEVEYKMVKQLFTYCERLRNSTEISEYDLVELNRQISNFNKNSLR